MRLAAPDRLVEAIEAHTAEGRRLIDDLTVVQEYPNGEDAMRGYLDLHRRSPERELYVLHTDRETLDVDEQEWLGLGPSTHQIRSTA